MFTPTTATTKEELLEQVMEDNNLHGFKIADSESFGYFIRFRATNPKGERLSVMWNTAEERYNIKMR